MNNEHDVKRNLKVKRFKAFIVVLFFYRVKIESWFSLQFTENKLDDSNPNYIVILVFCKFEWCLVNCNCFSFKLV